MLNRDQEETNFSPNRENKICTLISDDPLVEMLN